MDKLKAWKGIQCRHSKPKSIFLYTLFPLQYSNFPNLCHSILKTKKKKKNKNRSYESIFQKHCRLWYPIWRSANHSTSIPLAEIQHSKQTSTNTSKQCSAFYDSRKKFVLSIMISYQICRGYSTENIYCVSTHNCNKRKQLVCLAKLFFIWFVFFISWHIIVWLFPSWLKSDSHYIRIDIILLWYFFFLCLEPCTRSNIEF